MLMQEISALQQQLRALQAEPPSSLSDRVLAELLLKLQKKGLRLIYTADGSEFITPPKLRKEVLSAVKESLEQRQLFAELNVAQEDCEFVIRELLGEGLIDRVNGVLVSVAYKKTLLARFDGMLQTAGQLSYLQFSREVGLPLEYVRNMVRQDSGKTVKGKADDLKVVTDYKVEMARRRTRGALRGCTRPKDIRKLEIGQDELLLQLAQQLLETGEVAGELTGYVFTPSSFSKYKQDYLLNSVVTNGYIHYGQVSSFLGVTVGIEQVRQVLKGKALKYFQEFCVLEDRLKLMATELNLAFNREGYFQFQELVPNYFEEEELPELLQAMGVRHVIVAHGVILKRKFIRRCCEPFELRCLVQACFQLKQKKRKYKLLDQKEVMAQLLRSKVVGYQDRDSALQEALQLVLPDAVQTEFEALRKSFNQGKYQRNGISVSPHDFYKGALEIVAKEGTDIVGQFARRVKTKTVPKEQEKGLVNFLAKHWNRAGMPDLDPLFVDWLKQREPTLLSQSQQNINFAITFFGERAKVLKWVAEEHQKQQ